MQTITPKLFFLFIIPGLGLQCAHSQIELNLPETGSTPEKSSSVVLKKTALPIVLHRNYKIVGHSTVYFNRADYDIFHYRTRNFLRREVLRSGLFKERALSDFALIIQIRKSHENEYRVMCMQNCASSLSGGFLPTEELHEISLKFCRRGREIKEYVYKYTHLERKGLCVLPILLGVSKDYGGAALESVRPGHVFKDLPTILRRDLREARNLMEKEILFTKRKKPNAVNPDRYNRSEQEIYCDKIMN